MNIKDNKGITLVALMVTVVILAIIAYTSITVASNITRGAKFENVKTYMLLIRSKCEMVANEVAIGNKDVQLYGEEQLDGEFKGWYKLSQADLNDIGVKEAKAKDGYYVNYDINDVMYERGVENTGEMYFYLSQMQD